MKKLIIATLAITMLFASITTCFAEPPLKYDTLTLEKLTTNQKGDITALTLKDTKRGLTITFGYYDTKDTIKAYKSAVYKYDYTNNLLLITDNKGQVIWDELEL